MSIIDEIDRYVRRCKDCKVLGLSREDKQLEVCKMLLNYIEEAGDFETYEDQYHRIRSASMHVNKLLNNWEAAIGLKKYRVTIQDDGPKGHAQVHHEVWWSDGDGAIEVVKRLYCYVKEVPGRVFIVEEVT